MLSSHFYHLTQEQCQDQWGHLVENVPGSTNLIKPSEIPNRKHRNDANTQTSDNDNHEDGDVDSLAGNVQVPASRDDDSDNKKDVNDEHDEHDELCTYW